ncbi:hypothetical protein [Herbaspirillum rhizosphaerae]|uniref:hypothetical protein n=1 Tax=Herbaspirillum rhizosphaerae TaxID=346179 RepID=UPI001F0A1419|nr:hypothetical protein [Herbaspirillum rhizosphaerae]
MAVVTMSLMPAASVHASSADEWAKLKAETRAACLSQSGFKQAKVLEGPIIFSNRVLYRIGGIWPQKHMKGKSGKVYCLHPYPDGKAEIVE